MWQGYDHIGKRPFQYMVHFGSTHCVVAQHCRKGNQPVQWDMINFDPLYILKSNPCISPNLLIHKHQNVHMRLHLP